MFDDSKCVDLMVSIIPEIRQLEGEKQSLVYNHHHELIAASDTIRAVRHLIFPFCSTN